MGEAGGMVILIVIVAVVLVGGFLFFWLRDAKRNEAVGDNPDRIQSDPGGHTSNNPADRR